MGWMTYMTHLEVEAAVLALCLLECKRGAFQRTVHLVGIANLLLYLIWRRKRASSMPESRGCCSRAPPSSAWPRCPPVHCPLLRSAPCPPSPSRCPPAAPPPARVAPPGVMGMTQIHFMLRSCDELAVRLDPVGALPARQLQHASPSWRNAGMEKAYMLMLRPGHALQHSGQFSSMSPRVHF